MYLPGFMLTANAVCCALMLELGFNGAASCSAIFSLYWIACAAVDRFKQK